MFRANRSDLEVQPRSCQFMKFCRGNPPLYSDSEEILVRAFGVVLVRMDASSQGTILGIEFDSRGVVPHCKEVRFAKLGALHGTVRSRALFRLE
jgi:hypothetical protein